MKKIISTLALLLIVSTTAFCQTDKEYSETLKKYFDAVGNTDATNAGLEQMVEMFKSQFPDIDSQQWDKISKEIFAVSMNDYFEIIVPIYQKYLTKSDLEEMIKFYQTPIGQKVSKSNTLISKELISATQQMGMELSKKLIEIIQKAKEE